VLHLQPEFASTLPPSDQDFHKLFTIEGEIFRMAGGRTTLRFTRNGKRYFLKTHSGVGWAEIGKNLIQFRLPVISAIPEWRALLELRRLGIETAIPVAYGVEGTNPARKCSFIITEDLGPTTTLEELLHRWKSTGLGSQLEVQLKRTLIRKVAAIARTLHQNGINHRDFYLCHLHIPRAAMAPAPEYIPPVFVMDLHRAQIRTRTPRRWIVKDLGSLYFSASGLGLSSRDFWRFMTVYDALTPREIAATRLGFWKLVGARTRSLTRKVLRRGTMDPSGTTIIRE
jgi:hypothetical protein